jgi:hypothetical protein
MSQAISKDQKQQGIVPDQKNQEQPANKDHAQTANKADDQHNPLKKVGPKDR